MLCSDEHSRWLHGISPIKPYKCNNDVTVKFVSWVGDVFSFILTKNIVTSECVCVCVSADTGLMVFIVSLVVGILLLLVLVIGGLMYCIRKRRPAKRYRRNVFPSSQSVRSLLHVQYIKLSSTFLSIFNFSVCVYFCIDAFDLPQDNSTQFFGQAVHEAALVLGPHT